MDADGRELPRGEIGEIWIHGGSVIKGYWNNPKATAESFTGGFWHSGDLGSIDAENFVRVFDRKKDMINRGGLKIYSAEVEIGAGGPSRRGRERDHRQAVPGAGRARACRRGDPPRGVSAEVLRAWCAERLSDYKVPETITLTHRAAAAQRQRQGDEAAAARRRKRKGRANSQLEVLSNAATHNPRRSYVRLRA